jgi:hypothetical protein
MRRPRFSTLSFIGNSTKIGTATGLKVARVRRKQGRHNAWEARFGKIADAEFHVRKIKRQPPISNGCLKCAAFAGSNPIAWKC